MRSLAPNSVVISFVLFSFYFFSSIHLGQNTSVNEQAISVNSGIYHNLTCDTKYMTREKKQ